MLNPARTILVALLMVWACAAAAEVAVPPLTGRVVDQTATLSGDDVAALTQTIRNLELRKGSADVASNALTSDMVLALKKEPNLEVAHASGTVLSYLAFNLRDPVLRDGSLSYAVTVVDGEPPTTGADVSVFIDIIGMPLTPLSYAGVARRSYRRAFYYR